MVPSAFNSVDLVILIIIGLSILIGILRGATREVLGIAGWIGAFAVVFYGLPLFRPLGRQYINSPMMMRITRSTLLKAEGTILSSVNLPLFWFHF